MEISVSSWPSIILRISFAYVHRYGTPNVINLCRRRDSMIAYNSRVLILQGLTVKEMEELRIDIKMHLELDRATPTHVEFWEVCFPRDRRRIHLGSQ